MYLNMTRFLFQFIYLAPVVLRVDNTIHWINLYLVDYSLFFITSLLDNNLSVG